MARRMAGWVVARRVASWVMLQPSSSRACRQARRSAKPSRLACWSRRRCWVSMTVKSPVMVRRRRAGAAGGVAHALGVPGAPPLREIRHHQGSSGPGAIGNLGAHAHGKRRQEASARVEAGPEFGLVVGPTATIRKVIAESRRPLKGGRVP
jgi:hypothetical protein